VTFSGLLNILDGAVSSEERLIFMTTNYVDRLDSALIRPGRIDLAQLISDATPHQVPLVSSNSHSPRIFLQIRNLFCKFYPDATEEFAEQFVSAASVE
jgi:hypothetical protein